MTLLIAVDDEPLPVRQEASPSALNVFQSADVDGSEADQRRSGSSVTRCGWPVETEIAHFPSGDRPPALPSPRRTGRVPSNLRSATAYPGPAASLASSNRTNWPSREISLATFQSCQESSTSSLLPRVLKAIASRFEFNATSTCPSGRYILQRDSHGQIQHGSEFAGQAYRHQVEVVALSMAVNQISLPFGRQATPCSDFHSAVRVWTRPARSTTQTVPRLSQRAG